MTLEIDSLVRAQSLCKQKSKEMKMKKYEKIMLKTFDFVTEKAVKCIFS